MTRHHVGLQAQGGDCLKPVRFGRSDYRLHDNGVLMSTAPPTVIVIDTSSYPSSPSSPSPSLSPLAQVYFMAIALLGLFLLGSLLLRG